MNHYRFAILVLVILMGFFASGCAYKETVTQEEEVGYLKFTGNHSNIMVKIDDNPEFQPTNTMNKVYEVEPGVREIRIFKEDELKIHREIYIDAGNTREVKLP